MDDQDRSSPSNMAGTRSADTHGPRQWSALRPRTRQPPPPDDLELLGTAAWWAAQPEEAAEALERAFASYQAAGRAEDAGRVAPTSPTRRSDGLPVLVGEAGWGRRAYPRGSARFAAAAHNSARTKRSRALMEGRNEAGLELADKAIALAGQLDNADALVHRDEHEGLCRCHVR